MLGIGLHSYGFTDAEFWEREKGINRDVLVGAVQDALLSAAKKAVGPARELRVEIDQKNGDIKAFAKLIVSDKVISSTTRFPF
jgi:transcription termination/antitermination protein NusA